ncbi:receptor-type tyrosine-protein phosphatase V-like [Macrobrachium nipponense]|uniref:receptor-type tyrosine-protein phosphatase V-like n=1 Tax=Macrobrachium nipponense TaxID=159736 RepID=UPI0030C7C46D
MVFEKKAAALVILNTSPDNSEHSQVFPAIIPEKDDVFGFDSLRVKAEDVHCHFNFKETKVSLLSTKEPNSVINLKVLQLMGWPCGSETPSDSLPLITLLDHLDQKASQSTTSPIVFICSDGVTACGVAVALFIAITRLKHHGDVNIYKATQGIRLDRPQFITSMSQYLFLHKAMAKYLEMQEPQVTRNQKKC